MIKSYLFLLGILLSIGLKAQTKQPVQWTFSLTPGDKAQQFVLHANVNVEEGWHVFTNQPGGDGLLIPTDIVFKDPQAINVEMPFSVVGKAITKNMDGVGEVNYVEKMGEFTSTIMVKNNQVVEGVLTYQVCNDRMCLPPTDVPFRLELTK